ncbi:unnamed protein product, partial [Hymenolepis diminuta]
NQVLQHHRCPRKKQNKASSGITNPLPNKYEQSTTPDGHNSKASGQDKFWSISRRNFGKQLNHHRGWNDRERKDPRDKQKSKLRKRQNRKSNPEELRTYLNEGGKGQEHSFHKLQNTPTPSRPEPVTPVHAEFTPLHASKKPSLRIQIPNNAQSPTSTLINNRFSAACPSVPNASSDTIVVLSDQMPTFITGLPNIVIFPPGSRTFLSEPQNYIHYATGITLPDVPLTVPFQCLATSSNIPNQSQILAGNNPEPTNLETATSVPVHTSKRSPQPMEHMQPSPQVTINRGFPGALPAVLDFALGSVIVVSNEQNSIGFSPSLPIIIPFCEYSYRISRYI